jgi:TorA maturation chaperone TorD
MFSRLFLKPLSEADIDTIIAADYASLAMRLDDAGLLAEGFTDIGRSLARRHTGTRQELATDYTMCFDGVDTVDEQVAVPYESVFLGDQPLLNQEPRNQVYLTFLAESVSLKGGIDLPEDHLSFELEFLALLSDRAAAALASGNSAEAVRNLQLSRDFINQHILSWYDLLMSRANKMLKTRFYRGVMKATRGYIDLDLSTIEDMLDLISV